MHAVEGTVDEVLRGEASWCVVHGDALHVLRDLPDVSVSAFVTDPPYSSGGAFRGDRVKETTAKYVSTNSANKEIPAFEGDVRDQRSFTLWTALWSSEAWRAGADGAHLVAFSDSGSCRRSATRCRRAGGCGEGSTGFRHECSPNGSSPGHLIDRSLRVALDGFDR